MNCAELKKRNIIERYVTDELSEKEKELFEEHYFSCPKCLEELVTMQQIARGVRELAESGEIAYKSEALRESLVQRLARLGEFIPDPRAWRYMKPAFYTLLVLVLLMVYPTVKGLFFISKLGSSVNVTYYSLDVARGMNRIDVPPYSDAMILEFSVAERRQFERYDAEIADQRGTVIWKDSDLKRLGDFGTFSISFDRNFLREGTYSLTVYGFKDNTSTPIETFPFQIIK